MNIGFSVSETYTINGPTTVEFSEHLLKTIYRYAGWKYNYTQKAEGYLLIPTFRDMSYRNSFVPEISVIVSQSNGRTTLHMKGQPVKVVRAFMGLWFAGVLGMELLLLLIAVISGLDSLSILFVPIFMGVFGYLLCKVTTRVTFRSVVKAIQKAFP